MKTHLVKIWDLPTRLFHWILVAGIAFMWFSAEVSDTLMDWHARVGEFLLALVLFRIIWGFVGSESARFISFVRSPATAINYAKTLTSRKPSWHAGHNPAGGWMVIALLGLLLVQGITGLFTSDDILVEGPLYALVPESVSDVMISIHHLAFNILLLLIVFHIAVIAYYKIVKQTNLVPAMIKGSAEWPEGHTPERALQFRSPWLGLILWAACYAIVHFGLKWLSS
ncbi:MAG: cytochrome b/b6 domain-containing protein [Thiolinea sp.]